MGILSVSNCLLLLIDFHCKQTASRNQRETTTDRALMPPLNSHIWHPSRKLAKQLLAEQSSHTACHSIFAHPTSATKMKQMRRGFKAFSGATASS